MDGEAHLKFELFIEEPILQLHRKIKPNTRKNPLLLVEILIVIALLAIGASILFWRLDRWIEHHQFQSDTLRLKSLILQARSLALHTQSDWELHLHPSADGIRLELVCREDPLRPPSKEALSPLKGALIETPITLEFYSSGALAPQAPFTLHGKNRQSWSLCLPELFQQKEFVAKVRLQPG